MAELHDISMFLPTNMDRRMIIPIYRDLSEVKLSIFQKTYICSQMDHNFAEFADNIGADKGCDFIGRYHLKQSPVGSW